MMLLWGIRFFVFKLYESPKYLMGRGRDEHAVEVIHLLAEYNGKMSHLTLERLQAAGKYGEKEGVSQNTSALASVKRQLAKFKGDHVKALFATRRLAYSTSLLIVIWGTSSPTTVLRWLNTSSSLHWTRFSFASMDHYRPGIH
jgi:hypothetical protein